MCSHCHRPITADDPDAIPTPTGYVHRACADMQAKRAYQHRHRTALRHAIISSIGGILIWVILGPWWGLGSLILFGLLAGWHDRLYYRLAWSRMRALVRRKGEL